MEDPEYYIIDESPLTINRILHILSTGKKIKLAPEIISGVEKANAIVLDIIQKGDSVYGINTGFGKLSNVAIPGEQLTELQYNLLKSHATGVGEYLPAEICKIILLLKIYGLSKGFSGCSVSVLNGLTWFFNQNLIPAIRSQGSVGASGDLAPLAHLALPLIGLGEVYDETKIISTTHLLSRRKFAPVKLGPKDGLSLINGTQALTGILTYVLIKLQETLKLADLVAAISLDVSKSSLKPFSPEIYSVRPHPGHRVTAENFTRILKGSEIHASHQPCEKIQDPYCIRCIPQVHGSVKDTYAYVFNIVEREINSVTDNPLVFPETGKIISGGNFHGEPIAHAADFLAIALSSLANISERRLAMLVDSNFSKLPAFLVKESGINSGFMLAQVTSASLVNENKTLSHPSSVDSIPTSANQEDYVSMGFFAARKLMQIYHNLENILLIELLAGYQGLYLNRPLRSSFLIQEVEKVISAEIAPWDSDRVFYEEIDKISELYHQGKLDFALDEIKIREE